MLGEVDFDRGSGNGRDSESGVVPRLGEMLCPLDRPKRGRISGLPQKDTQALDDGIGGKWLSTVVSQARLKVDAVKETRIVHLQAISQQRLHAGAAPEQE